MDTQIDTRKIDGSVKYECRFDKEWSKKNRFIQAVYLFKGNNKNTRTRCEICSKLTLNIFHALFWYFYC